MTKHWIEAYVDHDTVSFRLACEHPTACEETAEWARQLGCAVKDWFDDAGIDLLGFPRGVEVPIGRIEVRCEWQGAAEDSELYLRRPASERAA